MDAVHFFVVLVWILVVVLLLKNLTARAIVFEYERGLMYRDGKLTRVLEPGAYWVFKKNTFVNKIDMRPRLLTIAGQEVMTSDGVSLKLSVAAQYKVIDPRAATLNSENYYSMLYTQVQLALRDIIGGITIDELLDSRANIGSKLLELCAERAKELGLELSSAAVKDIMLTGELKKAFTQVMKARKEGQAALERARGETAALRNLANAAKMMEGNPALMQLRALQTFAENGGNTLVLGMPPGIVPLPQKVGSSPASEPPEAGE